MKQRILVAIIGVPALIGVLCFAPDWATAVLVAALCVIGCHEFMAAAAPEKAAHWWGLAATLAVFTVFTVYFSGGDFTGTAIHTIMVWLLAALIVVMFIAAVQAFGKDDELDFPDISAMAVSGLVIPLALGCLVRLRMLEYGAGLVLIPLVSAFMSDSLALFGGMLFGKTKLAPRVSPKKTREGAVSGNDPVLDILLPMYGGAAAHRLVCAVGLRGRGAGAAGRPEFLLREAAVRHQGLRTAAAGPRRRAGPVRQCDLRCTGDVDAYQRCDAVLRKDL